MKTASICAGVIGYSYALKFAMGGNEVWAQNRTEKSSELAKERVRESLHSLVVNGVYSEEQEKEILARIHFTTSVEIAVKDAGFIQESSAEHYDVKHEIVKQIEEFAPEDTVIASSTSGLLVTEIAKYARYPERFVGGHPYNPPHLIPLVEITKGEKTEDRQWRKRRNSTRESAWSRSSCRRKRLASSATDCRWLSTVRS